MTPEPTLRNIAIKCDDKNFVSFGGLKDVCIDQTGKDTKILYVSSFSDPLSFSTPRELEPQRDFYDVIIKRITTMDGIATVEKGTVSEVVGFSVAGSLLKLYIL